MEFSVVLTAIDDENQAKKLANLILEKKLGACVQIQKVNSFYRWRGKIENSDEFLLQIKTLSSKIDELQSFIIKKHTYETPEIIALPIETGLDKYLDWIESEIK